MGLETINFTKIILPQGREVPVSMSRPSAIARKFRELEGIGFEFLVKFDGSNLRLIAQMDLGRDQIILEEKIQDGTELLEGVDRLIEKAHKRTWSQS